MKTLILRWGLSTLVLAALLMVQNAEASHFRYGHIYCTPTANANEVECDAQIVYRRSYSSAWQNVGQIVNEGFQILRADGSFVRSIGVPMTVTAISVTQDLSVLQATFTHTFTSGDPHIIRHTNCCRISPPTAFRPEGLRNRADQTWVFSALVDPDGNAMPRSSVPAVYGYPQSSTAGSPVLRSFPVIEPDGDDYRCRLSTDAEAGGGAGPAGLAIDPDSCEMSWDNAGLTAGYYTTQVMIEELDSNGDVRQRTSYDFFLNLGVAGSNTPPVCRISRPSPINVVLGQSVSFDITGTDEDGDQLEIASTGGGLPSGATMSPSLPLTGAPPLTTTFDWTPGALGSTLVSFSVSDGQNVDQCTMRIDVTDAPVCGMPYFDTPMVDNAARTVMEMIHADDPGGLVLVEFKDANGDPYLIGGEVTHSDGFVQDPNDPYRYYWDDANGPAPTMAHFTIAATADELRYYVVATNSCQNTQISDPVWDMSVAPDRMLVEGNFPNPFSDATTISFTLPEQAAVTVVVYDMLGREVTTLVDRVLEAGAQQVMWDGRDEHGQKLSSGVYVYRITGPDFSESRQMTLLK